MRQQSDKMVEIEMDFDKGFTTGYCDALEGRRTTTHENSKSQYVQGYSHGWSCGNSDRIEKEKKNGFHCTTKLE